MIDIGLNAFCPVLLLWYPIDEIDLYHAYQCTKGQFKYFGICVGLWIRAMTPNIKCLNMIDYIDVMKYSYKKLYICYAYKKYYILYYFRIIIFHFCIQESILCNLKFVKTFIKSIFVMIFVYFWMHEIRYTNYTTHVIIDRKLYSASKKVLFMGGH